MPQSARLFSKELVCQAQLGYWLYLPRAYEADPQQRWPLILFLHGAGERGADLEIVKVNGIPRVAERDDLPFVALSPQCPAHSNWMLHRQELLALLDETAGRYRVDTRRVYLTGLSMGGFGTWDLALEYPARFAAIAPICGGVAWHADFAGRAGALQGMGVWAFHGAKDEVVPLSESQRAVEALRAAGVEARLTIYPEAGHDSWTETYDNPELYTWFLSHQQ